MTSVTTHPHHQFINNTLPAWYVNATEQTRQLLNSDMVLGQQVREQLGKALAPVKPLDAFARPLLTKALEEEFGPGLDVDKTYFFKHIYKPGKFGELHLAAPEVCLQTLLHAALQNFHQEEVDNPHQGGKVQIVEIKQVVDTRYGTYDQYPLHPMNVDPSRFMSLCRKLDLGGKYQAHLDSVLGPYTGNSSQGTGLTAEQVADLFGRKEHNALKVQAHIAYMRNDIPEAFYQQLLGLPERSRSGTLNYFCLKICDFSVRDILIFQIQGERTCVVYVPGEPNIGMKAFSSFDELNRLWSRRFTPAFCKAFMNRFIAQRSKGAFFNKVLERIAPAHIRFDPEDNAFIPRLIHVREVDPDFDLDIELDEIPYDLFTHFNFQKMLRIKDDARVLAVPTGDEDEESRRVRLAGYVAMGMNVANLAALFVPLLGEAMMVVAGAQLLTETFQGIGAWSHADMHEALEHLDSVAQNLAFMAAFGALVKAGTAPEIPPVKGSSFVGKMVPIKLPGGETRLWSPDLTPFAHDVVPPQGAQLSGEGVFTHEGKRYLPLDGRFYPINYDPALNKWRIEPPRGERFSPMLEHNGAGGWRHEGENPLSWDTRTSFKRLGPEAATLPDALIEAVMKTTATNDAGLLELHLNNQPPPPGLADAIMRFKADEEVGTFYRQINDVAAFASANPQLQMELLVAMPRWPIGRPIEVLDAQGLKIAEYGTHVQPPDHPNLTPQIRPLQVTQAQIAEGKLLPVLIEGLGESGQNRVFGRHAPHTPQTLAAQMAGFAEGRASWLFDRLYQARDAGNDPLISLIRRDFPSLPRAAARELVAQATTEQVASMSASHRLPLEIAGRGRGYAQEIRLNRALEGFCLASKADNPDTLKVAVHLLERLPGWPGDIRIEIRDGAVDGPLLESLAQESATQRRIMVKRGLDYRAVDAAGGEITPGASTHNNFFTAVLQALPETARQAIGFPDPQLNAETLRLRIVTSALQERESVSKILGQWTLRTGFRIPTRLADGRVGYVLSGRGPFFSGLLSDLDSLVDIVRALYPEASDIYRFVDNLLLRSSYVVSEIRSSILNTQRSFETLRTALEAWAEPPNGSTSQAALARRTVAESISRAWRGRQLHSPLGRSALTLESIDFSLLEDLPDLPEHYADIDWISLRDITADVEQVDRFLVRFPRLLRVELMSPNLSRLPSVLPRLERLNELSLEGMGMTIDQGVMNQLMELRQLSMLDLSSNRLGELTDVSRLAAVRLYLTHMQLTRWPEGTDSLNLGLLDVSNNQIEHLPQYLIENQQGSYFQMTVYAYDNPIVHSELLETWCNQRSSHIYELEFDFPDDIRNMMPTPTTSEAESQMSSDEDDSWHTHSHGSPAAPVATVDIWWVEGREQLNSRTRIAWERVEQAGDAPNLLILLQRLRETPDFRRVHEELTNDVMWVLEAAADDAQLRGELEIMANDRLFGADQTCQDGARLIFSDIQVSVYSRSALQGVPEAQQTETLFGVLRSLFRLNEVQAIADLTIADREARGVRVDHAEVRMAYRIGLANELNLPAQPVSMAWDRLAAVDRQAILETRRLVLQREAGPEFIEYALADRRWTERLCIEYQADLERVSAPIRAEQEALLEHPPIDMVENLRRHGAIYERLNAAHAANDPVALAAATRDLEDLNANPPIDNDEFDRQGRALMDELAAAEKALLEQMTNVMRQGW